MSQTNPIQRRRLVLVVEDQEINRDVLGLILEDYYDVLYAVNGEEGLNLMRTHAKDLSIVLLDLIMPVMDGFQVLEEMNRDALLSQLPVIVLTAEKSAELRALQMGAADFITKPFDMHEVILARVSRIIELCEGREVIRDTEYDPLTRLYSPGFFFKYADQITRFRTDLKMDAIALNIERFHSVNDINGREFGDKVLRTLADALVSLLPEGRAIACRSDADRFFAFCDGCGGYPALLEGLQAALKQVSKRVDIRLRMGVCPFTQGLDVQQQFDRAKTACNLVRGSYRGALMVYDDSIRQREMYQQALLNDLHHGLESGQFRVFYQPKYNIQAEAPRLSSAEALIRWQHPERGMISPGDFIPLFESNGLIHLIDTYVWEEVARQIADWRDRLGVTVPVSVNLSRTDVFDPQLENLLLSLMEQHALEPSVMKLEVTESAYTDDAHQLISVINRLREQGFQIEMDDFGSGYSSLNMLSALPIDVLKMDMKFIQNIERNDKDFRLIQLILDIAKYLGVPVVAEGVETENQMRLLREAGCDLCQGFFFSRPIPAEQFEQLMIRELIENRS